MTGVGPPSALDRATTGFRQAYAAEPTFIVRAPGRVNLIGEHTDYNDGFALPMALPFDIVVAAVPLSGRRVLAESEGFGRADLDLDTDLDSLRRVDRGWGVYVQGMAVMLEAAGHPIAGWQGCVATDIPTGASLSSSAALEVAAGLAFVTAAGETIGGRELAIAGQRVENEVLGLPSGIMDQLTSALAEAGSACLIDCRDLTLTPVPLPEGLDVVIMDTGTRRVLAESAYAERRADCVAAAAALGVGSLRDAAIGDVGRITDERLRKRARHVVTENARTLDAAAAMRAGDIRSLGRLMDAGHASLRDDYDVSGPALDAIVTLARSTPGCLGARMTGGGFAGCAVAVVDQRFTADFVAEVTASYRAPATQPPTEPVRLHVVRPGPGAALIPTTGRITWGSAGPAPDR